MADEEVKGGGVLSLSELTKLCDEEYTRRAENLRVVENELEEKSVMRDVVLSVRMSVDSEERSELGSNMAMLSLVSDYFHALFQGDSSLRRGETIELSAKLTLEGMSAINALAFGVLSKVQVSRDNLAHLMAAAEYCEVPALSQLCDEFVRRHGIHKDATLACKLLTDLDHLGFASKVDDYLDQTPPHCLQMMFVDQSALRMSVDLFCSILKSDDLMLSEDKIWHQCVKWAENQVCIGKEPELLTNLSKLKPYIRFPLMSEEFLIEKVISTAVLSGDEFLAVRSFVHGSREGSSLFCSFNPRSNEHFWDKQGIVSKVHSISENGKLLIHRGKDKDSTAFIKGSIENKGTTAIEFEHLSDYHILYGVMEATEKPQRREFFGNPLRGVGFNGQTWLWTPKGKEEGFGETLKNGDRLRMTVAYSDPTHATLVYHRNGEQMGRVIQLEAYLHLSKGLRFAVQTTTGRKIRIL